MPRPDPDSSTRPRPSILPDFPYLRFAGALALGAAGGWAFAWLNLPLPWMLGAMVACTLAALVRAPIAAPPVVRPPMTMIIGVMLGSAFSPEVVERLATWIPSLLGLVAFLFAAGAACTTYFRLVGGLDPKTAYFAGMPGGLVEMVLAGDEEGGDARTIALVHAARLLLIVLTLPFLIRWLEGAGPGTGRPVGFSIFDAPLASSAWLVGTAVAGAAVGYALRLPAKYLLGPMLVSAAIHLVGLSDFVPPYEIVNGAQVILGATIGARFIGTPPHRILSILGLSTGSVAILILLTLGFGFAVAQLSGQAAVPLVLAYSPGGLAEMSLVALALQIEAAFVAGHHIVRILLVMVGARLVFRLLVRAGARRAG